MHVRSMYVFMVTHIVDQPGKVANPARGLLNRKIDFSPVRVRATEFGLARRVRQSRAASACSLSNTLAESGVLTYGILPEFRGGVHLFI